MAIIGYARVSTDEQDLELQRAALRAAGCERIFEDHGVSAAASKRPGFEAALASLEPEDTLVVWKLDRAFRKLKQSLDTLEEFEARGIYFYATTERIDTTTALGKLTWDIRNAFAEFERRLISERTKAGLAAAKSRGATLGRKPILTDAQVAWARKELQGAPQVTAKSVALRLGVSPRTLGRALARGDAACPG